LRGYWAAPAPFTSSGPSESKRKSILSTSRLGRLAWYLRSGDVAWMAHRVRRALTGETPFPRPAPLVSRVVRKSADGADVGRGGPLRLLVFSHNLDYEGASISLKELVFGLKDRLAVAPRVVACSDGPLRAQYEAQGIRVHLMPDLQYPISTLRRLEREVRGIAEQIRVEKVDVVLVNTLLNFPVILAAERAGVPSVWNPRESEPWQSYFRFLPDPVARQAIGAIGLPSRVVFVAEATRQVWKEFDDGGRFTVIHNSLDLSRFAETLSGDKEAQRRSLGWGADEVAFLCVGTLCERKGQADALVALEEVAAQLRVPIRLVFVGDAANRYGQRQQRRARRERMPKVRVDFVDATVSIGRYYLASDVFLLCSRVESFPRVVLEALAFGLPIITTPVYGVAEQLPDPRDAYFYQPGDVVTLGAKMLALANNPDLRRELAQRSRARFAQMPSFAQMVDAYERVLRVCAASTKFPAHDSAAKAA